MPGCVDILLQWFTKPVRYVFLVKIVYKSVQVSLDGKRKAKGRLCMASILQQGFLEKHSFSPPLQNDISHVDWRG